MAVNYFPPYAPVGTGLTEGPWLILNESRVQLVKGPIHFDNSTGVYAKQMFIDTLNTRTMNSSKYLIQGLDPIPKGPLGITVDLRKPVGTALLTLNPTIPGAGVAPYDDLFVYTTSYTTVCACINDIYPNTGQVYNFFTKVRSTINVANHQKLSPWITTDAVYTPSLSPGGGGSVVFSAYYNPPNLNGAWTLPPAPVSILIDYYVVIAQDFNLTAVATQDAPAPTPAPESKKVWDFKTMRYI